MFSLSEIESAAQAIAQSMINDARNSGDESVVFVTGNSYMPPMRSYPQAEVIWQGDDTIDWEVLIERINELLNEANVHLDSPEYDNCLYVVDTNRFEMAENADESETLSGEWQLKQ